MAAMKRMRLTDAAIARLRSREREYTVWDSRVSGFGVRVRPSGGRSYVLLCDAGGRSSRVSLGPVSTMSIAQARRECLARQAAHEPDKETAPTHAVPLLRAVFAAIGARPAGRHSAHSRAPASCCST